MTFYKLLITWYLANKRDLPWRNTTDPYAIWLSEIILQQTKVIQGLPYFEAFIEQFPKVSDLANAEQEQVLKLWQGLGYYSRARNLHETAKYISETLNAQFPNNYTSLLKLKGIGPYTAAAIASFAYNEPIAVVDGNVFRVLARVFGIELDISTQKTRNYFQELANSLLNQQKNPDAAIFNQAIMDFGAMQCTPKNPNCNSCPFSDTCVALANNQINQLPVKLAKTKVRNRYFEYVVVVGSDNTIILNKRTEKDIWNGLYEFDLLELDTKLNLEDANSEILKKYSLQNPEHLTAFNQEYFVHKLSHQNLNIRFWKLKLNQKCNGISINSLDKYAYPIVIANFIEKNYDKFS